MKVKITKKGYEYFNGMFGHVEFKDGISVQEISQPDAERLGCIVPIVKWEGDKEGEAVSIAATVGKGASQRAEVKAARLRADQLEVEKELEAEISDSAEVDAKVEVEQSTQERVYTIAELETVADKEGMPGLREIADPMGVKAKSIKELIDAIIKAQREAA